MEYTYPNMDDVYTGRSLYEWKMSYLNNGQSLPSSSISGESKSTSIGGMDGLLQRKQVSSIKNEGLGLGDKPDYYTLKVGMGDRFDYIITRIDKYVCNVKNIF